jgi:AmiR/NasT family two-component response regulator
MDIRGRERSGSKLTSVGYGVGRHGKAYRAGGGTAASREKGAQTILENPITIEAVLRLNAFATIPSPVRSFGLLTAIAVALMQFKASRARERYIERLEQKQAKGRVIQQATRIVMDSRGMSEEDAYQLLRSKAMLKREQIETVAGDIVKAHETLSF